MNRVRKQIEELDKELTTLQYQDLSIYSYMQEARAKMQLCCHGLYALSALLVCSGLTVLVNCSLMTIATFVLVLGYFILDCIMMWACFTREENLQQISQKINENIEEAKLLKLELEEELTKP